MHVFLCGYELGTDDATVNCCYAIEECLRDGDQIVVTSPNESCSIALQLVLPPDNRIQYQTNRRCISKDDLLVFNILRAIGQQAEVNRLTFFDGENRAELSTDLERVRRLQNQLEGLASSLRVNRIERAELLATMARKTLLDFSGSYVSLVYERLGAVTILIDTYRTRYYASLPSNDSALIYSKKNPIECWVDFFATINPAGKTISHSWPEIAVDQKRIQDFYADGMHALSNDLTSLKRGNRLRLLTLLWLAAYFVRKCEYYIVLEDGASAIALAVRVLETYLHFRLYELGLMELDPMTKKLVPASAAHGRFRGAGDGVKDCLRVLVTERQFSGIDCSQVEMVIHLRNRSAITHGVQRLEGSVVRAALGYVKSFITNVENVTPNVGGRWANLIASSFAVDWAKTWERAFSPLLELS
ncbi:hypothetical protein [Burkholderia ubonensis]|uniref:hypothetical protein n=1 Tax=Burkholderia ubonensis TaxID=101571 RepID=UPI000ABD2A69|nr:hypothetical protein [Burkholderia ubonensis]